MLLTEVSLKVFPSGCCPLWASRYHKPWQCHLECGDPVTGARQSRIPVKSCQAPVCPLYSNSKLPFQQPSPPYRSLCWTSHTDTHTSLRQGRTGLDIHACVVYLLCRYHHATVLEQQVSFRSIELTLTHGEVWEKEKGMSGREMWCDMKKIECWYIIYGREK